MPLEKLLRGNSRPRLCFVAHFAYGALAGGTSGHIGGVERQTSLMARWFAGRGYPVSMLTWDEGQKDGEVIEGVHVFKLCRQDAGMPGLRFLWPKWTSLVAALKRADADIYYQNCAEYVTGQVALWCRRHHRAFIYSIASDPDCDRRLPKMHSLRERILYRYGLSAAGKIIAQTTTQHKMLKDNFRLDSTVLPMPCPGPSARDQADFPRNHGGARRVLWVGTIYRVKRPDRLLDLAELCPDLQFDVLGQSADDAYARRVRARAAMTANVNLHGPVPRDQMPEFYRKASVLCCTSDFEGFPNTFLEAWSWGLPVVSTFDPDGLIIDRGLGQVAKDVGGLAAGIRALLDSPERWARASHSARDYYRENHDVDKAMPRFEQVFLDAVNPARST